MEKHGMAIPTDIHETDFPRPGNLAFQPDQRVGRTTVTGRLLSAAVG